MMYRKCKGFSLIELVVVIVLIGIVATAAIARMARSDSYNAIIVRDQIVSLIGTARQKAIGRSGVVMTLEPAGSELLIRIEDGSGETQLVHTSLSNVNLRGDVNQTASCAAVPGAHAIRAEAPMLIRFNGMGDIVGDGVSGSAGFPQPVHAGMRLCINNDPLLSVCVSATGFAHAGDCHE